MSDELASLPVEKLHAEIAYHLNLCPDCLQEYEALAALTADALQNEDLP
ncbi:MAG TPA: hypothetical protein VJG32_06095 [Anaerolineae bacterium]|nr:hypothetical protein [Anaerolineae bacterium]